MRGSWGNTYRCNISELASENRPRRTTMDLFDSHLSSNGHPARSTQNTLASDVYVDFQHWRVELEEDWLIQFGSPHYEASRARAELFERCGSHGRLVVPTIDLHFPRAQIVLANEVFPE